MESISRSPELRNENRNFKVLIVGGGLAGIATALAIMNTDEAVSVLVVDNSNSSKFKIGESLPPEARLVLSSLGKEELVSAFKRDICSPCTANASSWGSADIYERNSIMNPYGEGWHLDRAKCDQFMRDWWKRFTLNGVRELYEGTTFQSAEKESDGRWVVTVRQAGLDGSNEATITCDWLVDASGRKSCIARKEGYHPVKHDQLLSFYAVFDPPSLDHPTDLDQRTIVEACENGWWYTSLLPDHHRVVAFHTDANTPTAKQARRHDGFLALLHEQTTHLREIIERHKYAIVDRKVFPQCTAAHGARLERFFDTERQWIAVGDSALAFDPLSSQGMITALKSGALLGRVIGGNSTSELSEYSDYLEMVWKRYVSGKRFYYNKEHRWPQHMFWKARLET